MGAGRNREDGEGSRRCHFSRPSPCARLVQRQGQRRARGKGGARIPVWRELEEAGVTWPRGVSGLAGRGSPLGGAPRPTRGLQVHFGARFFLCVRPPAPGVCAPCRRRGLARRARPSLRQWVWAWVGEEGESGPCLLPLPPLLRFFFFSARCHLFAAGHVSVVACQALWLGFGGPGWDPRGGAGGGEHGDLGV